MKTTKIHSNIQRWTEKRRLLELRAFVVLCFASLDQDDKEIANSTHLSASTIYRLRREEFSLRVQWKTIQALGLAAGYSLEMSESSAIMRVVR